MKKTLFATAAMAALLGPVALSAQRPASNPTPAPAAPQSKPAATVASNTMPTMPTGTRTHDLSGRIVRISDTNLIISFGQGKQAKERTFMVYPTTKREGTLTAGEMVKVEYWMHGKDSIATLVQVQGLKTAATPTPPRRSNY